MAAKGADREGIMDYGVFDRLEEEEFRLQAGETEQGRMERILQQALAASPGQEEIFNDRMRPEFAGCDAKERVLKLKFPVEKWQQNPNGVLHGGIIAAMMDITFGVLSRYYAGCGKIVTVQMNLDFMRRIPVEGSVCVIARVDKAGRRISFLSARLMDGEAGKLASEASAVFMVP